MEEASPESRAIIYFPVARISTEMDGQVHLTCTIQFTWGLGKDVTLAQTRKWTWVQWHHESTEITEDAPAPNSISLSPDLSPMAQTLGHDELAIFVT